MSVHSLLDVTQQLRGAFQQLRQKRVILIHIPFVFREIAPLMTQREQSHLNLADMRRMHQALKDQIAFI
jgi:hypothetical protein